MRTLKLTLAYDGTAYAGWQRQANAVSVQEILENELAAIVGARVPIVAAGRTDAGVHAAGQVASVRLDDEMTCDDLARAAQRAIAARHSRPAGRRRIRRLRRAARRRHEDVSIRRLERRRAKPVPQARRLARHAAAGRAGHGQRRPRARRASRFLGVPGHRGRRQDGDAASARVRSA